MVDGRGGKKMLKACVDYLDEAEVNRQVALRDLSPSTR